MNIISPIILLMGIANIIGTQYLLPTKRQKEFTISVLVGIGVNFILNYIMIKLWNSIGACIATVISQLTVDIVQWYFVKDEINFQQMLKLSYIYLFSSLIMFACCMFVGLFVRGILGVIIQIALGVIVYFGVLILFKDEFVYVFINKVREKITGILNRN